MDAYSYLDKIKLKITLCSVVKSVKIIDERVVVSDRGCFKARMSLVNNDFIELFEYFKVEKGKIITSKYRYQWMDGKRQKLFKRWDNSRHFPNLSNYPHHVHIGTEDNVQPSKAIGILELIDIISKEIQAQG